MIKMQTRNGTPHGTRMQTLAAVALILAAGLFAQGAGLFAQGKTRAEKREEANTRSVMGVVVGPDDQPAVGAVIQLKDMRTLQVRSFITQGDGEYHFSNLRADIDYQLTAKSGDTTAPAKTLSIFDNRKEAVMNFKLEKK
jgi:hypothetical protein